MIVVTGMQRSGTSLVCQLLAALGVPFGPPADLIPADRWNENGYFEPKDVVDLNSRIITGLPRFVARPRAWWSKVAYLRMPGAAAIDARATALSARLAELGRRHAAQAVKDPRFCLTLRYWRQWADVGTVVVCMREPAAVLASLGRRHRLPKWLAARFFAWHVDALLGQLPAGALFVDVDRLVAGDAGALDELRRGLGLTEGPPSAAVLRAVVQPRAWSEPVEGRACPAVAAGAWQRLVAAAAAAQASAVGARG